MISSTYNPWLHRFAVSTVCVAMITLVMGALVTSKNAGMAFRDWPTSDGQNMLTYPWLRDFAANWDKFLEHGHRLAGVLIGLWSIALAGLVYRFESRRWLKLAALGVLGGVVLQGVLGGFRVWFDERGLAMLHGAFAACVFSLMAVVATALGPRWNAAADRSQEPPDSTVKLLALMTVGLLAVQYLLGGMIRHQGTGLHEHLALGVVALLTVVLNTIVAHGSGTAWIKRSGWTLLAIVLVQIVLGGAAWVTKFGFGATGYVAVADSIQQITFRTAHTVVGIVVFMTAVVHAARVWRVAHLQQPRSVPTASPSMPLSPAGGAV